MQAGHLSVVNSVLALYAYKCHFDRQLEAVAAVVVMLAVVVVVPFALQQC
jgi:hypothetical protein